MTVQLTGLTLRQGRQVVVVHAGSAGGQPEQGHAIGVAAEGRDVALQPSQRQGLVLQAVVARDHLVLGAQEACTRTRGVS